MRVQAVVGAAEIGQRSCPRNGQPLHRADADGMGGVQHVAGQRAGKGRRARQARPVASGRDGQPRESVRGVCGGGAGEGARHLHRVLGQDIDAEHAVFHHRARDPAVGAQADEHRGRIGRERGEGAHRRADATGCALCCHHGDGCRHLPHGVKKGVPLDGGAGIGHARLLWPDRILGNGQTRRGKARQARDKAAHRNGKGRAAGNRAVGQALSLLARGGGAGLLDPLPKDAARQRHVARLDRLGQGFQRLGQCHLGQVPLLRAQDAGMRGGQHVRADEQLLVQLLAGAQPGDDDLDIALRVVGVPQGEARRPACSAGPRSRRNG